MKIQLRKRWQRLVSRLDGLFALWEMRWSLAWQSLGDLLPFDGSRLPDWKPKPFRPLLEPLEYRWLMSVGVTEYSSGTTANPLSITSGPDGNLWYTAGAQIAKMTTSGSATAYSAVGNGTAYDITSDGTNLWFTYMKQPPPPSGGPPPPISATEGIGKITTSGTVTLYLLDSSNNRQPNGIVYGPDGNIWFVESGDGEVDKFVPSTQTFTRYAIPSGTSSNPQDIVSDGTNLWISEESSNKIAKVSTSGSFTEYTVPTSSSQPFGVTVGSDGSIWFSEYAGNKIGHFLPSTATFIEYAIPTTSSHPEGMAVGADGNVWTVENSGNNVTEVTSFGSVLEVGIPTGSSAPTDVTLGPDNLIWLTENGTTQIGGDVQYLATGNNPAADPNQGLFVPLGPDQATPGTGDLRASIPIDYRVTAGSGGQNAWGLLPGTDALVYNSNTADVRPIEQATMPSNPAFSVPASISASLVWNGGTPQATVTYGTTGHSAGDTYLVDQQASSQVTASADYLWAINLKASYPGQTPSAAYRTVGGSAFVVSNPGTDTGYYGWALGSFGQLVGTGGGLMWIYGSGGARFYQQLTSTTFQSPANDFGTLVKNTDGSYTYTSINQLAYNFNSSGYLIDLVDPNGLRLTYTYNGSHEVTSVAGPDGGVTTFQYDTSNRLTTIMQAGGGVVVLTPTGSNLTGATYANNSQRTFAYDGSGLHHLVYDQLGSDITTVTYDSTTGVVSGVNNGSGNTASLTPQNDQAFGSVAPNASAAVGVSTDANNNVTTYTMDSSGRLTLAQLANGGVQTYTLNTAGQVTVSTDPLGHITTNTYNASGDLTQVQEPDGGIWTYQYDSTYHVVNLMIDPLGDRTTYTIDSSTGNVLEITNALNQVTTQTWQYGELHTVTNPLNQTTTYDYDSTTHRLTDMVDATGARTTYGYDAQGDMTSVENPLGRYTTYAYDGNRNLLQVNYADGSQVSYAYNAQNQKTSQTDQLGHVTAYSYNLQGWLTTIIEASGTPIAQTIVDAYDANGNLLSETDGDGNVTSYAYDSMNRQTEVIKGYGSSAQAITTTVYDLAGNVLSVKDPLGNVTSYAYDAMNRRTVEIDAYGVTGTQRTTTTTYDKAGNELSVTDPRGTVTCYQYDALNRQTTVIADRFDSNSTNLQATTTTAYDKAGNVLSTTDPIGHTTSYAYDADQRQTQQIKAFGASIQETTTTVYDAAGNVLSVTDPRGTVTSYAYDTLNRQTQAIQAYGTGLAATTTTVYDLAGNTLSVTDPIGTVASYGYDALNRRITEIDAYGTSLAQTITTVYDKASNVVQTINAQGGTTTMTYDAQNRQVTAQDPNGNTTTTVYNALNKTATVDPLGDRTTYAYDALNRQVTVTNALSNVTTTVYDANNNQTVVVDADGNRTTMTYDPLNRETQMTDPLNHSGTYAYDLAGNQISATDRDGNVINSSYDALNRLTTTIWIQGGVTVNTLTYSYDGDNNQLTDSNNAGTYTMVYNALNEMTSEQEPFGAVLTMTYDAVGDRTQLQDSFGGTTTDTYDALHRLGTIQFGGSSQTPLRVDMTYTALNQLATMIRYSNLGGTTTVGLSAYGYDAGGRMTNLQQQNGSGSTLENYTYTYDHADRATAEILNGSATSYAYDTTNQLTTVINSSGTTTYSYDATGNRTMTGYVTGGGNELLNDGTWTYTYDKDGNTTQKKNTSTGETWSYTYDNRNHMISASDVSGTGTTLTMATYVYDALGNRLEKDVWTQASGTTTVTRFAYDGENVWADLNSSNALQTRYIDGNAADQLFARVSAGGTAAWYLTDRQASVRNLTDNSGNLQDTITYDGFGAVTAETRSSFGDRYKYTGRELDSETGLQYNRARYLATQDGRWTSQDPLQFSGGDINLYRYVGNSPVDLEDPSGEQGVKPRSDLSPGQLPTTTGTFGGPFYNPLQNSIRFRPDPPPTAAEFFKLPQWRQDLFNSMTGKADAVVQEMLALEDIRTAALGMRRICQSWYRKFPAITDFDVAASAFEKAAEWCSVGYNDGNKALAAANHFNELVVDNTSSLFLQFAYNDFYVAKKKMDNDFGIVTKWIGIGCQSFWKGLAHFLKAP